MTTDVHTIDEEPVAAHKRAPDLGDLIVAVDAARDLLEAAATQSRVPVPRIEFIRLESALAENAVARLEGYRSITVVNDSDSRLFVSEVAGRTFDAASGAAPAAVVPQVAPRLMVTLPLRGERLFVTAQAGATFPLIVPVMRWPQALRPDAVPLLAAGSGISPAKVGLQVGGLDVNATTNPVPVRLPTVSGTNANLWNAAAVGINGTSTAFVVTPAGKVTISGNANAATTIQVQVSADGVNWFVVTQVVLAAAGDFGFMLELGASQVRLRSTAAATITATAQGR